jgi:acyl carrier protein
MKDIDIIDILSEKITKNLLKDPKMELDPSEPLISSGLLDSFNLVDLALIIEEEFGVRIEDFELNSDTFDTLEDLAELIAERQ